MPLHQILRRLQNVRNVRFCSNRPVADAVTSANMYKTPLKDKVVATPAPIYGGRHLVTMLPGSGIGPEVLAHVRDIFATAQVPVDFEIVEGSGEELVQHAIKSIRRNRVAIKGNLSNVIDDDGFIAPNVSIRTQLDLFVYVIHYRSYPNVRAHYPNLNLVIIRQNTEGEYAMLEHETVSGVVESMKIITRENTERLARFAFKHAKKHNRQKITVVHKSRQLEMSDGLFLDTIKEVAVEHPTIQLEDIYIDRCCQRLVKNPLQYDVLLMPNLYGNIASNIVCGLAGGAGLYSGINYGDDIAIFESATRHTGDSLAGKNIANPVAMLNASINMLRHLGQKQHAKVISAAVHNALSNDLVHTPDIGGTNTSSEVVDNIKQFIVENLHKYVTQF